MNKECIKIPFATAELAREELERILMTQRRPWATKDKKACRIYECPYCSQWHLTSKPSITIY